MSRATAHPGLASLLAAACCVWGTALAADPVATGPPPPLHRRGRA